MKPIGASGQAAHPETHRSNRTASLLFIVIAICLTADGCRTLPPMRPVDLGEQGWDVFAGQAVWTADPAATPLAGDLILASHSDGRRFLQFSKTPFTLATARQSSTTWRLEFPAQSKRFSGPGAPPTIVWFQLIAAWTGLELSEPWMFNRDSPQHWRLENTATGETLRGYLEPFRNSKVGAN